MEEGPRARQMAQRVTTAVSITRSALIYAPTQVRPALMLDLATKEGLRVQPREQDDVLEPLQRTNYWIHVSREIRSGLGSQTLVMWSVNQMPGIWVSFDINEDQYWLVFDREQLSLTAGPEWFGWAATALMLALIGAAVSVRFVNHPLARLAKVARQLARGKLPRPCLNVALTKFAILILPSTGWPATYVRPRLIVRLCWRGFLTTCVPHWLA
ncbi:hypothetical protein [Paenalcaligenes niemegkensis]|uniref:hypothetical protein n=1 Tax=Paenalcaligenes niemegkensis TaxID=2895469 RepID=UPI004029E141